MLVAACVRWRGLARGRRAPAGVLPCRIESHGSLAEAESAPRAYGSCAERERVPRADPGFMPWPSAQQPRRRAWGCCGSFLAQGLVPRDRFVVTGTPSVAGLSSGADALAKPAQPVENNAEVPAVDLSVLPEGRGGTWLRTLSEALPKSRPRAPEIPRGKRRSRPPRRGAASIAPAGTPEVAMQLFGFLQTANRRRLRARHAPARCRPGRPTAGRAPGILTTPTRALLDEIPR